MLGDYEEAEQQLQESLKIGQQLNDPRRISSSLVSLGHFSSTQLDLEQAQAYFWEALTVSREADQRFQEASCLRGLGRVAYTRGNYIQSDQYLHEGLALCHEMDWKLGIARTLNELGHVSIRLGNDTEAQRYFYESLQTGVAIEIMPVILETLVGIAELLATGQDDALAVELLTLSLHHPACRADSRALAGRLLNELEERIPQEVFTAAQERGQTGKLETVINAQILELSAPETKALPATNRTLVDPLSRRELEVLELIIEGYTNREIAGQLHISVNTVKKHINHIFSKLDVKNRVQAIMQAQQLNILP